MAESVSELQPPAKAGRFVKKRKFSGLPAPDGTFAPWPGLVPLQQIEVTPYGYVSTGEDPQFLLEGFCPGESDVELNVLISFTSYDCALSVKFCFDCGSGFDESAPVSLNIVSSGTISGVVPLPRGVKRIRFDPADRECIFAFHRFDITVPQPDQLAELAAAHEERKVDIVCFPIIDWEFRFQRPQQLLRRLARKGHRVFYMRTTFGGLAPAKLETTEIEERVTGIRLPGNTRINIYRDTAIQNSMNKGLEALCAYLAEQECSEAVVFVHLPFWLPYAAELKERFGWRLIYDCMDDHAGFENNTSEMVQAEHELTTRADLVVTSSKLLYERHVNVNANCLLLPNAADYEHFSKSVPLEQSPLAGLPRPIIGYYGALGEWFDIEAVAVAAQRHENWSFVLIGRPTEPRLSELKNYPNIHFLSEKPYEELPSYLSGFDVATIPFRLLPLTEATNPVKIYEYFTSGKPVVARWLPELERYSDATYLYESPMEFVTMLERAVAEVDEGVAEKRRRIAAANTWDARIEELLPKFRNFYGKASIIIVSYQSLTYLHETLNSVLQNTQYPDYEIIVVDNNSHPSVVGYLQAVAAAVPKIKLILNDENRGFAAANNQGLTEADPHARYLVLLNNDTITPPGWLNRLIYWAGKKDIGLVGPVTNSAGNEAKIEVPYHWPDEIAAFTRVHCHGHRSECFDIRVLAMYCLMMRREVFEKIGCLDESFGLGMFEDDDYAQRARENGYRVVCAEDVFVHHYGSASFSKLATERYRSLFERNRKIYETKWGEWIPHKYRC